jgi:hypothetical protein
MRSLIVGSVMALMMGSALAQQVGAPGLSPGTSSAMQIGQHVAADAKLGESSQKLKAEDKAYGAMLKRLPDKPYDPWHGVR